jgi:hypothetical protein
MNRFLLVAVKRSSLLPNPTPFEGSAFEKVCLELKEAITKSSSYTCMSRSKEADELWKKVYEELARDRDGLVGALIARAEAHVLRLSMVYALLDGSQVISVDHLHAALEAWAFCERSAFFLFGDATGNPIADAILDALRQSGGWVSRAEISGLFSRNVASEKIVDALQLLLHRGKARMQRQETGGRPVEFWRAM